MELFQQGHFAFILLSIFQPEHIILIVLALLLFFGGKKIPELMRGLGRGMKEFKDAQNGESSGSAPSDHPEDKPKA